MKPLCTRPPLLLLLAALSACGSDAADPAAIIGMYEVTAHTVSQALVASEPVSCGTEGAAVPEPPYFALVESDFGDVELEMCATAEPGSCTFTLIDFFATDDGFFRENSNTQEGGGTDCALYHSENRAVPGEAGAIRIESRDWIVYPDPAPADCALELAEALADSDDCYRVEVIEGHRLE